MKTIILKLLIFVNGYNLDPMEVQTRLAQLPVKISVEQYDFAHPQLVDKWKLYYALLNCVASRREVCVYVLPPLEHKGSLLAHGTAWLGEKFGVVWYVPGYDAFNSVTVIHEAAHTIGVEHDDNGCNLMRSDALSCPNKDTLVFNKPAINQVKRWLKRKKQ